MKEIELIRELTLAKIIAERAGMILEMNQNIAGKDKVIEALKQEIEKLKVDSESIKKEDK